MEPHWKHTTRWLGRYALPVVACVALPAVALLERAHHHAAHDARPAPVVAPATHDHGVAPSREATSLEPAEPAPAEPRSSCDDPARGEPGSSPRWPDTGDPLPARPAVDRCCDDGRAGATRWLGVEPHVPMAVVDDRGIDEADEACCAPWARAHSRWRAVDAYGQQVGVSEVTGGEGYDATACFELTLAPVTGAPGVGLYASESGAWRAPPTARWVPTAAQRAAFDRFLLDADRVLVDHGIDRFGSDAQDALGARVLFFTVPPEDGVEPETPTQFAVAGGAALVVAHVGRDGRWVADHVENAYSNTDGCAAREAYRPVAVFDMDGDGVPEIVVHSNGGDGWQDSVLQRDDADWVHAADSVGGSTA